MQYIHLENEYIKVSVSAQGAELQHFIDKNTERELMWNGNPDFWGKKSPVLFPIVGALKNNSYFYKDREYHLPRHGFARDMLFNVSLSSPNEAVFTLSDTPETLAVYPFKFSFALRYALNCRTLSCTYQVNNPDTESLLFSVGAHPAFAINTAGNMAYSNYSLEFNKDLSLTTHKIVDNLISNELHVLPLENGQLPLKHELFYDDALVIKGLNSDRISLINSENDHGLHFKFDGFPFFGIWAAKDADFVCLEPWCGIADAVEHDNQLINKEGIMILSPGASWSRRWEVEVF